MKQEWNDDNFQEMSWNFCRLYGVRLPDEDFRFFLDIDYIADWVRNGENFNFLVSPCLIKFNHVSNLKISLEYNENMLCFISEIRRTNRRPSPNGNMVEWDYKIECDVGFLSFTCTGFEQKSMSEHKLIETQDLNRSFSTFPIN